MAVVCIADILSLATQRLTVAGCDSPRLEAELLLSYLLNKDRIWLYLNYQEQLAENWQPQFDRLIYRREQREPVAYITGCKQFFALDFQINRHVLIPRPETELLVETALTIINNPAGRQISTVLDVGTGTGCIIIALAKNIRTDCHFYAVDLSNNALQLARQNAARHGVVDKIDFLSGDLLQSISRPVDMIISNPPYVSRSELDEIVQPEVSRYEPSLALDGGGLDGLRIIRRLIAQAGERLKPGGSLLVEIGATQGQAVMELAKNCFSIGADIQIKKDLAGLDRLLVVCV